MNTRQKNTSEERRTMPTAEQIINSMAEYIANLPCKHCPVFEQCNDILEEDECKEKIINFFAR